ncbi:MAG: S9 family peptidase [Chloroflexi bacterium]|nr:S9 family peptidase [Chloroflexota bacterium]
MPSPITPQHVYDLVNVGDPSLSPDGRKIAYTRSKTERKTSEISSIIVMRDVESGASSQFTSGPKDSLPMFSPDGDSLAFVRPDENGNRQLWLIPTSGGEARRLTSVEGGVSQPTWSPDSRRIAFVSDVTPDEGSTDDGPRVRVVRRIRYRTDTIGWRGDSFRHIFIVEVNSGNTEQLTDGEGEDSSPAWSPDGARVAFISDKGAERDVADGEHLYVIPSQGGEPRLVAEGLQSVAAATWSPDGSRLAVIGSDDEQVGAGWQGRLFVLQEGAAPVAVTDDSVRPAAGYAPVISPPELRWTEDDNILFLGDSKGESYLCSVPASGGEMSRVAGGGGFQFGTLSLDDSSSYGAVTSITPRSSANIALVDLKAGSVKQLTDYNRAYFEEHRPANLEKFTLVRDGFEIECRLYFPPDFVEANKYPLILDIHGGPHGVFFDAFNPTQQVLATHGYVVLAVNPRGSSTYGIDFAKAVLGDWGGGDCEDIMAAVDEVCERPYIDASRLGITGYSYGGFMSSWIIGHDARFNAAVIGAPVSNLSSFYGTSDIGVRFGERQIGGTRVAEPDRYVEHSPLTYVSNVETPVLLLHGEADARCPIEQSEQYFVALKRLGKEVEFVRFPDCSHMFLRLGHPKMREEYFARMLAWFDARVSSAAAQARRGEAVSADD